MTELSLPPLFTAQPSKGADPFVLACQQAQDGCDPGLVVYDLRPDKLRAAIVFAPEVPLSEAMITLPICGVGFQNAFGAIAPPEVGIHLGWAGDIRVNGGRAGNFRVSAAPRDAEAVPDWLVVGMSIDFWPAEEDTGLNPDVTALYAEGCGDVEAPLLLEAWVRHTLVWINRWLDEGARPIHKEWIGVVYGLNETSEAGTFTGVDENFGMILKTDGVTKIVPLTEALTEPS
jgi:biotin-(acetyl-CoA carboxylase) ligase